MFERQIFVYVQITGETASTFPSRSKKFILAVYHGWTVSVVPRVGFIVVESDRDRRAAGSCF